MEIYDAVGREFWRKSLTASRGSESTVEEELQGKPELCRQCDQIQERQLAVTTFNLRELRLADPHPFRQCGLAPAVPISGTQDSLSKLDPQRLTGPIRTVVHLWPLWDQIDYPMGVE